MKENCRQNAIAANIFRIKAVEADAAIKELFGAFESIKAKSPAGSWCVSVWGGRRHCGQPVGEC
jgi:hypothetical protein